MQNKNDIPLEEKMAIAVSRKIVSMFLEKCGLYNEIYEVINDDMRLLEHVRVLRRNFEIAEDFLLRKGEENLERNEELKCEK